MFGFQSSVARAQHVIHRFPTGGNIEKNFVAFLNKATGSKTTVEDLKALNKKHLEACKKGEAPAAGAKVLPNGRISLKNSYFGRGYLDQNRSPVTGQTIHEIHESIRRVPEPLQGFKMSGPHFLAQIQDHSESMKRFYWTVFYGFLAGTIWAILYRINDNAMFDEWDRTYREHLAIHQKYHAERLAKMAEEGIEYDTAPIKNNSESITSKY